MSSIIGNSGGNGSNGMGPNGMRPNGQGEERFDLIDRYMLPDQPQQAGYGTNLIDMAAIRGILFRQKFIIFGALAAALLVGLVYTMLQVPIYQASATVRVDPDGNRILEGQDLAPGVHVNDYTTYLETLGMVVLSRNMAENVTNNLNLRQDSAFLGSEVETARPAGISNTAWAKQKAEMAVEKVRSGVDVDIPFSNRILTITYASEDRHEAAKLANGYAQAFLAEDTRKSIEANTYAVEYLEKQITEIRGQLQKAELASNAYAKENQLVSANGYIDEDGEESYSNGQTITNAALSSVNAAYNEARAKRIEAEQRWETVASTPASQLPEVQQSTAIQSLIAEQAKASAELANLRERYDDGYPAVVELTARLGTLKSQIDANSADIKTGIRNKFRVASRQEQALKSELDRVSNASLDEQDRQVRFGLLNRNAEALRDQLAALLSRYNEVSSAANVQEGSITLIDSAVVPVVPVSPSLFRNMLVALVLGLGIAVILSVLREILDDRLRTLADVQAKLGIPLLGHTPHVAARDLEDDTTNPFSALTESYASIRSTIDYAIPRDSQVLQFTSSQASEGKTTSAVMVATQLARLGRRTLLIDADLRRPSIHKHLECDRPRKGLVEVLLGHVALKDALLPGTPENLDVLGISMPPPNPVELLSSHIFREFLENNRSRYSRIIIDTSPVMGIADAPLIASYADATVFIAEANRVHGGQAKAAVRRLRSVGANLAGVILTKFKALEAGQTYGYEYRYYTYHAPAKAKIEERKEEKPLMLQE